MAMTSFYTGPNRGRLDVASWDELVAAVQAGSLTETQWVECKAAIPAAAAGANLELAKDLASLTVDGGVLVIGVSDKATAAEHVVGTDAPLEALKDRISSVAGQTRVQPAMHVVFGEPLQNPDGSGRYALLVVVPQSATAPHMVDNRYWGRSAVGKRPLGDAEVASLFAQRRLAADDFEARLRKLSDELDPIPIADRLGIHVSVLVRPEVPAREDFLGLIDDRNRLGQALHGARRNVAYKINRSPNFLDLGRPYAHTDGPALEAIFNSAPDLSDRYWMARAETHNMRLLVGGDGALSVVSARGSNPWEDGTNQIDFACIVEVVHQSAQLAGFLGEGHMEYQGMWRIGVHVSGMVGALGHSNGAFASDRGQPFAGDEYLHIVTASTVDLWERPVTVVGHLLRNLARVSGFRGDTSPLMDPETTPLW
ncbi:hypothetical protein WIS52_23545 [Pseudonocardia nematodicida]|uniref:Schlafen AlbA-2 domain-containing protein n=1 Tax=Pseudonocardia nematodicida TaxID=1206997 RepID=A0ABV1KG69_9PSEU